MEFRDLKRQYQQLKPKMDEAIQKTLTDGHFISGAQVGKIEERLAKFVGVKHCISCANGTDALTLALRACDVGAGDAVFVPDFTFFATAETPAALGATPVFVDVEEGSFNMSAESLKAEIERVKAEGKLNLKAVIPVDLFGLPADYTQICAIAESFGMIVIEDGAQGFGGNINGKRACSFGHVSTTSFFPAKPLGCYGDGGAVFTDDDEKATLIRSLAVHGKGKEKYDNVRLGLNSRLDTIQAAVLEVKLDAFEGYELENVNKVAVWYTERLKGVVETPNIPEGFYSSWAQYTIRLKSREERDALQMGLKALGIPSMLYYPKMMHQQEAFGEVEYHGQCMTAEKLCATALSLPMHPYQTKQETDTICDAVIKIIVK